MLKVFIAIQLLLDIYVLVYIFKRHAEVNETFNQIASNFNLLKKYVDKTR